MKNNKNLSKKLLILGIGLYVIFTLANQQKTLNQYHQNSNKLVAEIEEEKKYKEELSRKKDDVDSLDFIEQTAREKLDMYFPNERIYMDRGM